MILLTTFSPTNTDNQIRALNSWIDLGYKVISFNSKSDITKLIHIKNVEFIEVENTGVKEFGKDYIYLNTFTDYIKTNGSALIINSDIELSQRIKIDFKDNVLYMFSRYDYTHNQSISKKFDSGFDAFYVSQKIAKTIPMSKLVIGQCHWDYFLPLVAMNSGFQLSNPIQSNMYHRKHNIQYNADRWHQTGKIFANELGLTGNVPIDSMNTFNKIRRKLKYG